MDSFETQCPRCTLVLSGRTISEAMTAKRDHLEQRHLDARIETDASYSSHQ